MRTSSVVAPTQPRTSPEKDKSLLLSHRHRFSFGFSLNRKLREALQREGRCPGGTHLTDSEPVKLWEYHLQLVSVEDCLQNPQRRSDAPPDLSSTRARASKHTYQSRSWRTAVAVPA